MINKLFSFGLHSRSKSSDTVVAIRDQQVVSCNNNNGRFVGRRERFESRKQKAKPREEGHCES